MTSAPFEELERELGALPPAERHTRLIERLSGDRELLPYYFKVLEMAGRQQLGLALIGAGDGSDVPADQKPAFDERPQVERAPIGEGAERESRRAAGVLQRTAAVQRREAIVESIPVEMWRGVDDESLGAAQDRRLRQHQNAPAAHRATR